MIIGKSRGSPAMISAALNFFMFYDLGGGLAFSSLLFSRPKGDSHLLTKICNLSFRYTLPLNRYGLIDAYRVLLNVQTA
jgi:hypothetical protein